MKYFTILILFGAFVFIGCEEKVQPFTSKNPYVELAASFDASTNSTTGTVLFWENIKGGNSLLLDKSEQALFQDKTMVFNSPEKKYSLNLIGYSVKNTFRLIDLDKKEFTNSIYGSSIAFPIDIQFSQDTVNPAIPMLLQWVGNAADTNEKIVLQIEDKIFKQDTLGAKSMLISDTDLMPFKGKSILVSLERYKDRALQEKPGSDGLISYTYKALSRKIYFTQGQIPLSQKNVYAEFSVIYDILTNTSTGKVQFKEGDKSGNPLFIDPSAELKFQNSSLLRESGGNGYTVSISGYLTQYTFRFVDINKNEYMNTISGSRISLSSSLLDTINTSIPLNITWSEAAVGASENVTLKISDKTFIQDSINAKNISVPASGLTQWKGTTQKVSIERSKSTSLQQKIGVNGSGSISNQYIAQPKNIYFK